MNIFSDISLWWLLPATVLAGFFSYYYYFKSTVNNNYELKQRRVLVSLRFVGLLGLFLLLFGLIWETISYRQEKPLVIALVDRSESMKNYSDSMQVGKQIFNFSEKLKQEFATDYEVKLYDIGEKIRSAQNNSDFKDRTTDIAAAFKFIQEQNFNRNIGAVCLISDGNYNVGVHPMYEAEALNLVPVFTLAVGDSSSRRDAVVKSLVSNDVAFVNNEFPIQALLAFNKMEIGSYWVHLLDNGKKIQSLQVKNTNANYDIKEATFAVQANQKGYHRYTVRLETKSKEFTKANNEATCFVEILDAKSDILILTSAPHPDIQALKSVLSLDKQAQIKTESIKDFQLKSERPDLVVWYENGAVPNAPLFKSLLARKLPVLMVLGPNISSSLLNAYGLSFRAPLRNQMEDVYPSLNSGFKLFETTKSLADVMPKLPPLRARFGAYSLPNNAVVMLKQRIAGIEKNDPLLFFYTEGSSKVGVFTGEGIWRWKMKDYSLNKNNVAFEELIQKTTQYLSVKQQKDPLRITLPKRFNTAEDVLIKAEFYNESMELITQPTISFELKKKGGKTNILSFSPTYNFYELNIGQLESGLYEWKAVATNTGKKYVKTGEFAVQSISLEKLESRANWSTLTQLANQSDGKFYRLANYNQLLLDMKKRTDITTVQYEDNGYQALIDWWWVFVLLIVFFGSEWFLRRFWGAY